MWSIRQFFQDWKFAPQGIFAPCKQRLTIILGGERITVRPLGLEAAVELALLLAPYVALLEEKLPELRAALADTSGRRPRLLEALLRAMAGEMRAAPGDLVRAIGLLAGRDPAWIAAHATPAEVVAALPILDRANDFGALVAAMRELGLTIKYKTPLGEGK